MQHNQNAKRFAYFISIAIERESLFGGLKIGVSEHGEYFFTSSNGLCRFISRQLPLIQLILQNILLFPTTKYEIFMALQSEAIEIKNEILKIKTNGNKRIIADNLYLLMKAYESKDLELGFFSYILKNSFTNEEIILLLGIENVLAIDFKFNNRC